MRLGGSGGMLPQKILQSRRSEKLFQHSPRDISSKKINLDQVFLELTGIFPKFRKVDTHTSAIVHRTRIAN